jgi:beta-N-acetylhexosaminidase
MQTKTLSNRQLAGQRLMVGFNGTRLNENLKFLIGRLKVGGIIFFSRNLQAPDQINDLCFEIQKYAQICGQPPLFLAIDQEGGKVARLKEPFTLFPGNPHMRSTEDAIRFAEITAAELRRVGINMNMAPVLDVAPDKTDSIMADRAFGGDPDWVSRLGVKVVEYFQRNNIIAVAKHFPGIGRTSLDSHLDLPILDDDLSVIEQFDLIPFKASIEFGVSALMLSHIFYTKLDSQWPASLSSHIARDLLRKRLGFDNIVLTDDLDMGAIAKHYDLRASIRQILAADIDIALICHQGPNIEIAYEEILRGISESSELKAKGIESVQRIERLKKRYLITSSSHFKAANK